MRQTSSLARHISIKHNRGGPPKSTPPSLLLSCRQIYDEAVGIYYNIATFTGMSSAALTDWLEALPSRHVQALHDVRYHARAFCTAVFGSWDQKTAVGYAEDVLVQVINKKLQSSSMDHVRGRIKASVVTKGGEVVWTTTPKRTFEASEKEDVEGETVTGGAMVGPV